MSAPSRSSDGSENERLIDGVVEVDPAGCGSIGEKPLDAPGGLAHAEQALGGIDDSFELRRQLRVVDGVDSPLGEPGHHVEIVSEVVPQHPRQNGKPLLAERRFRAILADADRADELVAVDDRPQRELVRDALARPGEKRRLALGRFALAVHAAKRLGDGIASLVIEQRC